MGKQIHRHGDGRSCGATTVVSGQGDVFANEKLVAVDGDQNTHGGGPLSSGANHVYINNTLVIRNGDDGGGDPVPGHGSTPASSGSGDVFAGYPTTASLGEGQVGYVQEPITEPPTDDPVILADEPNIVHQRSYTPGGGAIAPRDDGGPVVDAGNAAQSTSEYVPPYVPTSGTGSCARQDLGKVSERYESNGNASAIGYDTTGGWSWGAYQIATLTGTFKNYMSFCKVRYPDIHSELASVGGEPAFKAGGRDSAAAAKWKALKSNSNFLPSQHDFIQATHFDKLVAKIKNNTGLDICDGTHCYGLQDAIWSISVQHGPGSSIPIKGINAVGVGASDPQIISAIYDERDRVDVYFKRSTAAVRASVANRFRQERADCLALC